MQHWELAMEFPEQPGGKHGANAHNGAMAPNDPLRRSLRQVLQVFMRDHVQSMGSVYSIEEAILRRKFRELCAEARHRQIQAEHLIVAVKDAWQELTESHEIARGALGHELRSEVVTVVVEEYYRGR